MKTFKQRRAQRLVALARDLEKEGKLEDAANVYRQAIEADPEFADSYYNLGLLHKYRGEWKESLELNRRAAELDPADPPSWWNMGIAATALKDWKSARQAWRGFGLPPLPGGEDEEPRTRIAMTPVRLKENREVVWADRIDPARAILQNIPTEKSGRRWRDLILNDGAPVGSRIVDGRTFPVFNELELIEASGYGTFSVWVQSEKPAVVDKLEKLCEERDLGFENWSFSLRNVCQQCSEGAPHQHHDEALKKEMQVGQVQLAVAARTREDLDKVLARWKALTGTEVLEVEQVA